MNLVQVFDDIVNKLQGIHLLANKLTFVNAFLGDVKDVIRPSSVTETFLPFAILIHLTSNCNFLPNELADIEKVLFPDGSPIHYEPGDYNNDIYLSIGSVKMNIPGRLAQKGQSAFFVGRPELLNNCLKSLKSTLTGLNQQEFITNIIKFNKPITYFTDGSKFANILEHYWDISLPNDPEINFDCFKESVSRLISQSIYSHGAKQKILFQALEKNIIESKGFIPQGSYMKNPTVEFNAANNEVFLVKNILDAHKRVIRHAFPLPYHESKDDVKQAVLQIMSPEDSCLLHFIEARTGYKMDILLDQLHTLDRANMAFVNAFSKVNPGTTIFPLQIAKYYLQLSVSFAPQEVGTQWNLLTLAQYLKMHCQESFSIPFCLSFVAMTGNLELYKALELLMKGNNDDDENISHFYDSTSIEKFSALGFRSSLMVAIINQEFEIAAYIINQMNTPQDILNTHLTKYCRTWFSRDPDVAEKIMTDLWTHVGTR